MSAIETEVLEDVKTLTLLELVTTNNLVVHNDEVNTFDWVIQTLVDVCKHTEEQAEQCSLIIHYKGKCAVKSGYEKELQDMKNAILDRGIQATIE